MGFWCRLSNYSQTDCSRTEFAVTYSRANTGQWSPFQPGFGRPVHKSRFLPRRTRMAIQLIVNGKTQSVDVPPNMPLLWVLRDTLGMTGTKFGCGMALCGACTVQIEGDATRSCITP